MARNPRPTCSSGRGHFNVPARANRILNFLLIGFALILVRVWHLSVVQHEERVACAERPTRRTVIEPSRRASICDRFGIPLALSRVQYNASIQYAQIREIPAFIWEKDEQGKKRKRYKRREHIRALAELLASSLGLGADQIEDRIHAEASLYDHASYVIQPNISEEQYYRLKVQERNWAGLCVERIPARYYPQGKLACDLIGYMGPIDQEQYREVLQLRKVLRDYVRRQETGDEPALPEGMSSAAQLRRRLQELEELAYCINDRVGKSGIESLFNDALRGYSGKRRYYIDSQGNFLQELTGAKEPLAGKRVQLTISAKLQAFAEQLLAQNEQLRRPRVSKPHRGGRQSKKSAFKDPWIKGGAIVAMDPNNGQLLALASFPRFDPADFIPSGHAEVDLAKQANIRRWFESEAALAEIWDGKQPLKRELFNEEKGFHEQELFLSWEHYLQLTFDDEGDLLRGLNAVSTVGAAIRLQQTVEKLLSYAGGGNLYYILNLLYQEDRHCKQPCFLPARDRESIEKNLNVEIAAVEQLKEELDPFFSAVPHNYDKVLLVDLCRILVCATKLEKLACSAVSKQSLSEYRKASQDSAILHQVVYELTKDFFSREVFAPWRTQNEKKFLKEKRRKEREEKRYCRPFTEHLAREQARQFVDFWSRYQERLCFLFLTGCDLGKAKEPDAAWAAARRYFAQKFRALRKETQEADSWWQPSYRRLQMVLSSLQPKQAAQLLASFRTFDELTRPLFGRYRQLRSFQGVQLEKHLAAAFYPVYGYGYGRSFAYRQAAMQGSIFKLVTAYAALMERYRSGKHPLNPLTMVDEPHKQEGAWYVGYDALGVLIPRAYKGGVLPRTLMANAGKLDITKAIEVSSNSYFSLLASDVLARPSDLAAAARAFSFGRPTGIALPGEIAGNVPQDLEYNRTGLYTFAIGQHTLVVTPLQTSVMLSAIANQGRVFTPQLIQELSLQGKEERQSRFLFQQSLSCIGIDFPLFHAAKRFCKEQDPPLAARHAQIAMPKPVQSLLLEGMRKAAARYRKPAYFFQSTYGTCPELLNPLQNLRGQLLMKTSTAESVECFGPDRLIGTGTYNHLWTGAISFTESAGPEIVVVVYLRCGMYGKDAAPLAAQMIAKWREIKAQYNGKTLF